MRVENILTETSLKYPDNAAIYYQNECITYKELDNSSAVLAKGLAEIGFGEGQFGCMILNNTPHFFNFYFAIMKAGGVVVPVNPLFKHNEIKYILNNCKAAILIIEKLMVNTIEAIKDELPYLKKIIIIEDENYEGSIRVENAGHGDSKEISLLISPDQKDIHKSEIATCIYTSGTTGRPKGVLLSHSNLTFDASATLERIKFVPEDIHLCALPLFHSFGQIISILMPFYTGGAVSIISKFSPNIIIDEINKYKVTVFPAVPAMYTAILKFLESIDGIRLLSSLRMCLSGGAPMPVHLLEVFKEKFNIDIIEGNGPTETSPVSYVNPPDLCKAGSVGLPIAGVLVKILNQDGEEVQTGEIGEICVKGNNVMQGYLNLPEATKKAIVDGWLHTGDLGKMDHDNYVYIIGRIKDMLIVSGFNVYPREVEECLNKHPKVYESAVIGIDDIERGEVPIAFVVTKKDQTATIGEMVTYCRQNLASYKCPRNVIFLDSIPRNAAGKIDKKQLKEALTIGLIEQ